MENVGKKSNAVASFSKRLAYINAFVALTVFLFAINSLGSNVNRASIELMNLDLGAASHYWGMSTSGDGIKVHVFLTPKPDSKQLYSGASSLPAEHIWLAHLQYNLSDFDNVSDLPQRVIDDNIQLIKDPSLSSAKVSKVNKDKINLPKDFVSSFGSLGLHLKSGLFISIFVAVYFMLLVQLSSFALSAYRRGADLTFTILVSACVVVTSFLFYDVLTDYSKVENLTVYQAINRE